MISDGCSSDCLMGVGSSDKRRWVIGTARGGAIVLSGLFDISVSISFFPFRLFPHCYPLFFFSFFQFFSSFLFVFLLPILSPIFSPCFCIRLSKAYA
ncbi:hypothetical protein V8C26DRAFT_389036 [Trichoderma gracile]